MAESRARPGSLRLHVGCGLNAAPGWVNLDNSFSLLIGQHLVLRAIVQVLERLARRALYTRFPGGIRRWDVTRGLPYPSESVGAIYSSHTLEHLPRKEAENFLRECCRVLRPGGAPIGLTRSGTNRTRLSLVRRRMPQGDDGGL